MTEKEVCEAILENAKCKPVFVDFTGGITDQIGDDKMVQVDDVVGTMLWEAIQSSAENVSKSEWLSKAEVELLLIGKPTVDLPAFYDSVMADCKVEMAAYVIARSMLKAGVDPEQVMEQVEAELQSE